MGAWLGHIQVDGCFFLHFELHRIETLFLTRKGRGSSPAEGLLLRSEFVMDKREIKGRDFVHDMRAGMSNADLMHKYKLSIKGLSSTFDKLLAAKAIKPSEIFRRSILSPDTSDLRVFPVRLLSRQQVGSPLPVYVYDEAWQERKGLVANVSEAGIGIEGMEVKVDQTQIFVIPPGEVPGIGKIMFEAQCKWARRNEHSDVCESGLQITSISNESLAELRKLIRATTSHSEDSLQE